jgi:hypothetical protein
LALTTHEGKIDVKELSGPALRAFFRIAELWKLSGAEQRGLLGFPPKSTFFNWKNGIGTLSRDTLERISHILGIYKSLQILLPRPESADGWVKRPNTAGPFGGKPALERMLKGMSDLYVVRRYLDAQRGGWA